MRAILLEQYGGPEVLQLHEVPDPTPGAEEVLVDVACSALNRADLLQRAGGYPSPPAVGFPAGWKGEIPGLEFAGRVAAVGERTRLWQVGDPVMAVTGVAAFAEKTVCHERQLMRVPSTVALNEAAAIPEVWITAWDALVAQGGLGSGQVALVHAGGSGVGTAAIQIAKSLGAFIVVTCSASKVDRCLALGADVAVDYRSADYVEACRTFTAGRGVDVVLDVVGGGYVERNLDALAQRGRIVQVGTMADTQTSFPLFKLMSKRAALFGTVLRPRPLEDKIAVTQQFGRAILPLFESGACRTVVDRHFPLASVGEAQEYLAGNDSFGKIIIDVAAP